MHGIPLKSTREKKRERERIKRKKKHMRAFGDRA